MLDGMVDDVRRAQPAGEEHRVGRQHGIGGLAGSLLTLWRGLMADRVEPRRRERELRVMETLHVGGRRQLLLVSCAGERFLVGTSADGIGSIVRVAAGKHAGQPMDIGDRL